ncbi:hypothetical protein [Kitasatospora purpeofusca]|uniref:hypothetical protein n=1 Tax=Kitasatospora purpeofusca TaxID=67352 RepID=UPI002A5B1055|nr:hypothetical protein [Kitasatospora purpeofusca]MDY0815749.1 hypothetical protein [Kitasatospora purpeofusca]
MTAEQPPPQGNRRLLDPARPFPERVARLVRDWEDDGRARYRLVDGRPLLALYCWHLDAARRGTTGDDPATAAYIAAAFAANGGADGWDALLRERADCACHGDSWRLENISVCLGCLRYVCYRVEGPCCPGARIVG